VNKEKLTAKANCERGCYFVKDLKSDKQKQNAPTPDRLSVPGNAVGMKGK